MPRKLRIQYSGAMYHVMNRGDQREDIFRDDEDRQKFLATLGQACQKTEWQVHAYCLMNNHFHVEAEYGQLRRDWVLGSEEFRQELLATAVERVGLNNYGAERQESGAQKAQRIMKQELAALGWQETDLSGRPKGHGEKVRIARRLRRETTMSLKWIAQRLEMGSWTYVSNLLRREPQSPTHQCMLALCQK